MSSLTGILAQLLSAFSFGTSNVVWKIPLQTAQQLPIIILRTCLTTVLFGFTLLFSYFSWHFSLDMIALAFGLSAISFGGIYFFTKAMIYDKASTVVVVSSSSFIIGEFTSVFVLGDQIKGIHYISLIIFLISVLMVNSWNKRIQFSKGIKYALLSAFFWGTTLTLLSIPSKQMGFLETSFITEIAVLIMAMISSVFNNSFTSIKSAIKLELKWIVLLAMLSYVGLMTLYYSFSVTPAYIIVGISSITHLISVIISRILLKEQISLRVYGAAILSVIAVLIFIL